jgi:transposase
MDIIFTHCAGLDVHKKRVTACRVIPDPAGQHIEGIMEVKDFGTMTCDLLALADWLAAVGITHVAMESTGEGSVARMAGDLLQQARQSRSQITGDRP